MVGLDKFMRAIGLVRYWVDGTVPDYRKKKTASKPMKPLPKAQVKVDLTQAETMKCEYCENYLFISSTIIKRLSAIVSPTGEETLIPIDVYSCGNCGRVPKSMLAGSGIEDETPKENSLFRKDL
jgi:DNA-directed RNA polymerase subunit RPC12/RpoP